MHNLENGRYIRRINYGTIRNEMYQRPRAIARREWWYARAKEYFIKLETKAEWRILENVESYGTDFSALNSMIRTTGDDVMGDHDIYCYIAVDKPELAMGEQYTDADGLVWERAK